jgi:hypothetical protein
MGSISGILTLRFQTFHQDAYSGNIRIPIPATSGHLVDL